MDRDFGQLAEAFYFGRLVAIVVGVFGTGVLVGWLVFG
jgi:hypothetical protein